MTSDSPNLLTHAGSRVRPGDRVIDVGLPAGSRRYADPATYLSWRPLQPAQLRELGLTP
ncbi:hypothetical protein [Nonomuraea recticatena]|uniref:Uncharacterized protein n=1 Tax=Nonomuraea recticatena TaxID=46178 RepID=A0ABP6FUD6_9ACTN